MTDKEAYEIIGERVKQIVELPEIQAKMVKMAKKDGKKAAENWAYMLAIGTLIGMPNT